MTMTDVLDILDETPATWNGPHVGRRLMEGMQTLRLLPTPGAIGFGSPWPAYIYEFEDLLAQEQQGELERTQKLQNRTRLMPSIREIGGCEAAIVEIASAVNSVALAHALDRDAGWVASKRGGYADTWRQRHDLGCEIIAGCLRKERVPLF